MNMKKLSLLSAVITVALATVLTTCTGCGMSARDNELVGQVKKVVEHTPILCGDWTEADISLGVMRDGNGSMSREDIELRVNNTEDRAVLKGAAESGSPVKITYDVERVVICGVDHILTSVELLPVSK